MVEKVVECFNQYDNRQSAFADAHHGRLIYQNSSLFHYLLLILLLSNENSAVVVTERTNIFLNNDVALQDLMTYTQDFNSKETKKN